MKPENHLVKKTAASLTKVLGRLLESKDSCPPTLHKEYSKAKKCLDSLLEVMDKTMPVKESRYYEFQLIDENGHEAFKKMVGNLMTVTEACIYLDITEGVARNILHMSDHLVAVKAKCLSHGRHRMIISENSVIEFKKTLLNNPLGRGILSLYTSPTKVEERIPEEIICCDKKINNSLQKYII